MRKPLAFLAALFLTACQTLPVARATNFGTVVPKGATFASEVVAANNALSTNTVRVNMPLIVQLTDTTVGSTYYVDSSVPLQNTIAGSSNAGSYTLGDQLLQENTMAAATLNVVSGGSITVSAVGQPGGNPANAMDIWDDTTSGATFSWTPSGPPQIVNTYSWHMNAVPTGWAMGDSVQSFALSATGASAGTSTISSVTGQTVVTAAPIQIGIASPSDSLNQLSQAAGAFKTHAVIFNSCSPSINTNCPIRSAAEYTYQLTQTLSTICTVTTQCLRTFSPESEMDAFYGSQASAAQYLQEATLATSIGHSLGYIVYGGAPDTTGLNAWWWYCTFYGSCGMAQNMSAATGAALGLFVKTAKQVNWASNLLPTACNLAGSSGAAGNHPQASSGWTGSIDGNGVMTITANLLGTTIVPGDVVYAVGQPPNTTVVTGSGGIGTYQLSAGSVALPAGQPIYMNALNTNRVRILAKMYQILLGYPSIPYDFTNYHWYQTSPVVENPVMQAYIRAAGNKPFTLEENGTYSMSGQDVSDHLAGAMSFAPDMITWWNNDAGDGSGAVALLNIGLSLRPNGAAFKSFITSGNRAPVQIGSAQPPSAPPC
jgi:hypothetical protein